MRQILQNLKTGKLTLETVPPPALQPGGVRVRTAASLISAGTEKMLIDLARKSLVGKARARPDLVRQVIDKVRKEGLLNTYRNVQSKMEKPMTLGYSAAGIVESVGDDVHDLRVGDRIAVAGAGYANHAEVNFVPKNLCAAIPEGVSFEEAAYTTVASIALQGVRLARPELGDNVAVIGLGLIGLITVQLLQANGCRVLGIDLDETRVRLGLDMGMDAGAATSQDPARAVDRFTGGRGADHTFITAATDSNAPIELAGEITRRKGAVIAVGAVGLHIPRNAYYKKELEVKISMSYGPGRYDPVYEEGGIDYPYDYVRWTEQRNMEAVLDLMARKRLRVAPLTTHRYAFGEATDAYAMIAEKRAPYVGIILNYDVERRQDAVIALKNEANPTAKSQIGVGFIGAGSYATLHLLPHLRNNGRVRLIGLASATGLSARQKADKFGFQYCATDLDPLLQDDAVDALFIGTRHSTHAEFTIRALEAGKHVFVEKPMVVSEDQLDAVCATYRKAAAHGSRLMVGLNRRFAPMIERLRDACPPGTPRQMVYRVNSGHIPTTSWLHQPAEGQGMMIGEMCHFVDLMLYLAGEKPVSVVAHAVSAGRADVSDRDNLTLTIAFDGGSVGTLHYNTIGDKAAPKERLEVFTHGTTAMLDDFRSLQIFSNGRRRRWKTSNQDKGQSRQIDATVRAFCGKDATPIPFEELESVMRIVFTAERSLATGAVGPVPTPTPQETLTEA